MCVCICSNQAETCFGWNQKSRTWSSANNSWKSLVAANFCPQAILRPFSGHSTLLMFLPLNLDLIWLEMTRLPVRCNYVFPYNPSYTVWRPGNPFEINEGHLFDRNQILRVGKHSIWAFRTYRISSTAVNCDTLRALLRFWRGLMSLMWTKGSPVCHAPVTKRSGFEMQIILQMETNGCQSFSLATGENQK